MIDPALIRLAVPARLVTARLELRRDAVEDAPAVLAAVRASHADLAPWLSWITSGYDLAEATRGQRRAIEYWNAGDSFQWRLWSTTGTGGAGATGAARTRGLHRLHRLAHH
ncbi:MAG: hypothetical protein IPI49_00220 [Myxococcales bacterium]|nr:hypothetical protein [Myxococcales bacterium]